jgi:hypothetical protein
MALSIYPYGPVNLSIRPCKNIHTALLYGPVRLFNKSVTNWLSRSAVLALGANTANLESIPGPIQKQPVSNTIILSSCFLALDDVDIRIVLDQHA